MYLDIRLKMSRDGGVGVSVFSIRGCRLATFVVDAREGYEKDGRV